MVSDHGTFGLMEEMQNSKFKAMCLAVLDRVGKLTPVTADARLLRCRAIEALRNR